MDDTVKGLYWKTSDGRRIPIEKMEDQHLHNAIKYLLRTNPSQPLLRTMIDEQNRRLASDKPLVKTQLLLNHPKSRWTDLEI